MLLISQTCSFVFLYHFLFFFVFLFHKTEDECPPHPNFVARMHNAKWTGVIRHRSSVAIVTRRYCLLDDHCLSCHKLLTNSQVSSSSKQILGSLIFRVRWEDLASVGLFFRNF